MAFQLGENDTTNGVHSNKHIYYLYTYTAMQAIMQYTKSMRCGTGQRHEQGKALQPSIIIIYSHLYSFTCQDTAPQHSFKRKARIRPPLRQGGQTGPLGSYGAGPGRPNGSRETEQVTCTLKVPRWGESRRLSSRQLA